MIYTKTKEFILSISLISFFVLVGMNLCIYIFENAQTIQDVLPLIGLYLFTRFILPLIGLLLLAYTIRLYIDRHSTTYSLESNQSQGREGGGTDTPSSNINENSDRVGDKVKDFLNNANLSRFSLNDYPTVQKIYSAIGYNPYGANKQIQNENFGKLLISTKYFEQEKTFIILKPLYHKATEKEANRYYSEKPNNAYLLPDVSLTYRSVNREKSEQGATT